MKIIKRDGTPQDYSFLKIVDAVTKTFTSIGQEVPEKFLDQLKETVEKLIIKNNGKGTPVEEIQDAIQKEMIKRNKFEAVEAFINYRRKHEEIREQKSDLMKQIQEKLNATNVQNQNANLDEASFGGRLGETASVVARNLALKTMSKMARKNYEDNMIYVHDADHYMTGDHNCLTMPLDDLLANGFKTRQTDVRPAASINTAMQLVAVLFQLQSLQQFGGVSASHLDWTMVPYVRKSFAKHFKEGLKYIDGMDEETIGNLFEHIPSEVTKLSIEDDFYKQFGRSYKFAGDMTVKEAKQACEGLLHNLNTLQSRSGNQLPFTSINLGTCTLTEGRMITKLLFENLIEGLGLNGVTSIFPCVIFQYMKGVNDKPGTPNYDLKRLAMEATAKRIYPNYCNVDWSVNAGYDRNDPETYNSTMGKRNTVAHLKSFEPCQRVWRFAA